MFTLQNTKAAERKRNFGVFGVLAGALDWISDNSASTGPVLVGLTGSQDGVNLVFTLPAPPINGIVVFINGLQSYPGVNYNLNGFTVTFVAGNAPQATDQIEVVSY